MEVEEGVKVLGLWTSPYSNRVDTALKLKSIPYDYIEEEDIYGKKSELLLKLNPVHKKIPKPIAESPVILQDVVETWKTNYSILPQDPYQRAMARFWAKFIDVEFKGEGLSITVAGHSMGSSLGVLFAYDVAELGLNRNCGLDREIPITVFAFASPRVGNADLKESCEELGVKVLRIANEGDTSFHGVARVTLTWVLNWRSTFS
ncbi:glutathione S-transferase U4-like [Malania oleifera]|uniref:glutathione S-transferase U4-like n=1 Tax=Malania oleifera TaxID=397392 RepID=UPI0025AE8BAD|nr:glutathione S-transferase U4-like [Malania oleifera]